MRFLLMLVMLLVLAGCAQAPTQAAVRDLEQFTAALKAEGAAVEAGDDASQPFFSAPGRRLVINGNNVDVFEYASEADRQRESSTISEDGFGVGNSLVDWVDTPHFWARGRIIVLYVGKDRVTIDLISSILGSTVNRPPL